MQVVFLWLTTSFAILIAVDHKIFAGLLFWVGAHLVWLCTYQGVTAVLYAQGQKRLVIPALQALSASGGAWLLRLSEARIGLFGLEISSVEYTYACLVLGVILAVNTRPPQVEIDAVRE
jgi:hypothetical protein